MNQSDHYHSFFFNVTAPTVIYTLSLHDALPICVAARQVEKTVFLGEARDPGLRVFENEAVAIESARSEEHTSELQSRFDLVCRLLLEKKNKNNNTVFYSPASVVLIVTCLSTALC